MPWNEIHIKTTADYADQMSDQLAELGAQAVTFQDAGDQPIYEPDPNSLPLWQETIVIGLFDHEQPLDSILINLEQQQATGLIKQFHLRPLADQDWERICLAQFKPMQFGKRLWICPSWHQPPHPDAVNVVLDPGLAFGTGTHPTTALCLEWLDQHVETPELVVDYGCGSGILGIAALKLGAKNVLAIDNDPQALTATQQNAERNQLHPPRLRTALPPDFSKSAPLTTTPIDILIANILAQPLMELAPYFATWLVKNNKILLSGILLEQAEQVKKVYEPWFILEESISKGEWVRLAGYRR